MKAIRKLSAKPGAEVVDIDIPTIDRNSLLVKINTTALCKSDVDVQLRATCL